MPEMFLYTTAHLTPATFQAFEVSDESWCLLCGEVGLLTDGSGAVLPSLITHLGHSPPRRDCSQHMPLNWDVSKPWGPWAPAFPGKVGSEEEFAKWLLTAPSPGSPPPLSYSADLRELNRCIGALTRLYPEYLGPRPNDNTHLPPPSSACEAQQLIIDRVSFLRWWTGWMPECIDSSTRVLKNDLRRAISKWVLETFHSVGVVVPNLAQDWKTVNFPLWINHRLPVCYRWSDRESINPRFSHLSPSYLSMPNMGKHLSFRYDGYFQDTKLRLPNQQEKVCQRLLLSNTYVIDFEGWGRRPVKIGTAKRYVKRMPYSVLRIPGGESTVFYRWRATHASSNFEGSDSDNEDEFLDDPMESTDFVREMFAWRYGPHSGKSYDIYTGDVTSSTPGQSSGALAGIISTPSIKNGCGHQELYGLASQNINNGNSQIIARKRKHDDNSARASHGAASHHSFRDALSASRAVGSSWCRKESSQLRPCEAAHLSRRDSPKGRALSNTTRSSHSRPIVNPESDTDSLKAKATIRAVNVNPLDNLSTVVTPTTQCNRSQFDDPMSNDGCNYSVPAASGVLAASYMTCGSLPGEPKALILAENVPDNPSATTAPLPQQRKIRTTFEEYKARKKLRVQIEDREPNALEEGKENFTMINPASESGVVAAHLIICPSVSLPSLQPIIPDPAITCQQPSILPRLEHIGSSGAHKLTVADDSPTSVDGDVLYPLQDGGCTAEEKEDKAPFYFPGMTPVATGGDQGPSFNVIPSRSTMSLDILVRLFIIITFRPFLGFSSHLFPPNDPKIQLTCLKTMKIQFLWVRRTTTPCLAFL